MDIKGVLKVIKGFLSDVVTTVIPLGDADNTALNTTNKTLLGSINELNAGKEPLKGDDDNYVTDAEKIVIGNTSGANTGDQSSGDFNHNDLAGLLGGIAGQYYHLTLTQHTIVTQAASTSLSGYLTSTDWNTFNSKQDSVAKTTKLLLTGTNASGFTYDVENSGVNFTKSGDTGSLGADANSFNQNTKVEVFLNGSYMLKGTDAVWASATTFVLNQDVDATDEIIIIS
jgi:hypothetical protein